MSEKKSAYIFTGGLLTKTILSNVNLNEGIVIGVDRGGEWLMENQIIADYFVGDFDSASSFFYSKIKEKYPDKLYLSSTEKDETDTELAMRLAVSQNPKNIILFGGIGTRLDHVIANIHTLIYAEENNVPTIMVGSSNRIQLILPNIKKVVEKSEFTYTSLLPLTENVEGIKIDGFKYPIQGKSMRIGSPYGISNELIEKYGTISIEQGILLVIESKD